MEAAARGIETGENPAWGLAYSPSWRRAGVSLYGAPRANLSYGDVIVSIGPRDGGLATSGLSGVVSFLCNKLIFSMKPENLFEIISSIAYSMMG